jgi:hypothetical protein
MGRGGGYKIGLENCGHPWVKNDFVWFLSKRKKNLKEGWKFEDGIEKKRMIILITTKHSERIAKQLGQTSGQYHKPMTIVNDNQAWH